MIKELVNVVLDIRDTWYVLDKDLPECFFDRLNVFRAASKDTLRDVSRCPYFRRRIEVDLGIEPGTVELSRSFLCTNQRALALFGSSSYRRAQGLPDKYPTFCDIAGQVVRHSID